MMHVFEDVCPDWIGRRSPLGASADDVGCWWNRPAGENVLDDLLAGRAGIGPTANQAELAVFSKLGCNDTPTERATRTGVHLLTPGDLFEHS